MPRNVKDEAAKRLRLYLQNDMIRLVWANDVEPAQEDQILAKLYSDLWDLSDAHNRRDCHCVNPNRLVVDSMPHCVDCGGSLDS